MIRWGCLRRVLTVSLGAAALLIAAPTAPAQVVPPAPPTPLPSTPLLESREAVNPLGAIEGVPQPISIDELRRLLDCPALDADARNTLLDSVAEYRRRVAELRERELVPAAVALLFEPDDEARERARAARAAALERRLNLDRRLLSELQRHTQEASCAAILTDVRGAIERRFARDRIRSPRFLLGFDIEVGPLARAALSDAAADAARGHAAASGPDAHASVPQIGASVVPESSTAILERAERKLLDLLHSLEAEAPLSSERYRRIREERGLVRSKDAPPMTPEETRRYFAELDAVALEADAPNRAIASSIGRHHRATIEALRAAMPKEAWRRMRDRWYALTYGGPFHRQLGHPSNAFEWTLRALRRADPADETAIATLEAHAAEWRRRRDALETKLADAVDAVRAAGGDAPIEPGAEDPLEIAVAPILDEIEALDTATGDQIAAVSGRIRVVFGQGASRSGRVMRRAADDEPTWPPRPASRRMARTDDAPRASLSRSDEMRRLQPLDQPWLDSILDRHRRAGGTSGAAADAVATDSSALTAVTAVSEEQRLAAQAAFDVYLAAVAPFHEFERDRSDVMSRLPPGAERNAMADVHDARELWFEALAREEAVLFETLGRILGPDATGGWTALRFELAERDRERLRSGMRSAGGGNVALAISHEDSLDLVRLIDDDPSLSSLRDGGDAERRAGIIEHLRSYGRRLAEARMDFNVVAEASAEDSRNRRTTREGMQELDRSDAALRRVHRDALARLQSMLEDPTERAALRRAYARAAWPVVFGRQAATEDGARPELAAVHAELARLDEELLTELLKEPPRERVMNGVEIFERLLRFDGIRWEREEQLLDLALRRASAN